MFDQLRHQRDVISLEAGSGGAALTSAVGRLGDYVDTAAGYLQRNVLQSVAGLFSRNDLNNRAKRMSTLDYMVYRERFVAAPPGLNTDLLSYVKTLEMCATQSSRMLKDTLGPFNSWLSARLGNPDSLRSLMNTLNIEGYTPANIEELTKQLTSHFHAKDTSAERPYKQLFARQADWVAVASHVSEIDRLFDQQQMSAIQKEVDICVDLLQKLVRRIQDHASEYQISGTTLTVLSTTIYLIGREVEFNALLRAKTREVHEAIEHILEEVK